MDKIDEPTPEEGIQIQHALKTHPELRLILFKLSRIERKVNILLGREVKRGTIRK